MTDIKRATEKDAAAIVAIGSISVEEAHRDSCAPGILKAYMDAHYNEAAIRTELQQPAHWYHLLYYNQEPVGFSKIVLNANHASIDQPHTSKLDRIYLLKEYQALKLGKALLDFNIELAKQNGQTGMWLFTWIGNERAIRFYQKAGFEIIGRHQFLVSGDHYNENHHMLLKF
jgi:ribosomal protein S18 acetylase RimI-like enzyme